MAYQLDQGQHRALALHSQIARRLAEQGRALAIPVDAERFEGEPQHREHARERAGVLEAPRDVGCDEELPGEVIDDLIERAVRHPLALVASPPPHRRARHRRPTHRLVDERRLADPRRARHEDQAAARRGIAQTLRHAEQRLGPPDEAEAPAVRGGLRLRARDRLGDLQRRRPPRGARRKHPVHQRSEIRRQQRHATLDARDRELAMLAREHVQRTAEGRRARHELEREHPEGVHVERWRHLKAVEILRREIRRGPDDAALRRELAVLPVLLEREPEVQQLRHAIDDEDVRRFDVAMDHPAAVEERERLREPRDHAAHPLEVDGRHRAIGARARVRHVGRGVREVRGLGLLHRRHCRGRRVARARAVRLARGISEGDPVARICAREVLHREVAARPVRAELVELDEVRVPER